MNTSQNAFALIIVLAVAFIAIEPIIRNIVCSDVATETLAILVRAVSLPM